MRKGFGEFNGEHVRGRFRKGVRAFEQVLIHTDRLVLRG